MPELCRSDPKLCRIVWPSWHSLTKPAQFEKPRFILVPPTTHKTSLSAKEQHWQGTSSSPSMPSFSFYAFSLSSCPLSCLRALSSLFALSLLSIRELSLCSHALSSLLFMPSSLSLLLSLSCLLSLLSSLSPVFSLSLIRALYSHPLHSTMREDGDVGVDAFWCWKGKSMLLFTFFYCLLLSKRFTFKVNLSNTEVNFKWN